MHFVQENMNTLKDRIVRKDLFLRKQKQLRYPIVGNKLRAHIANSNDAKILLTCVFDISLLGNPGL